MPNYDYFCESCENRWEEKQTLENRDLPLVLPCPSCNAGGFIKRGFFTAARISYDGNKTILQRAGTNFNDLLVGIKKASGKQCTYETR